MPSSTNMNCAVDEAFCSCSITPVAEVRAREDEEEVQGEKTRSCDEDDDDNVILPFIFCPDCKRRELHPREIPSSTLMNRGRNEAFFMITASK